MQIYTKLINFFKSILVMPVVISTIIFLIFIVFLIAIFRTIKLYKFYDKLIDVYQWFSGNFFTFLLLLCPVDGLEDDIHYEASLIVSKNIILFLFVIIVKHSISAIYNLVYNFEDNYKLYIESNVWEISQDYLLGVLFMSIGFTLGKKIVDFVYKILLE
ncbi:MAG: hypothetical protein F6K22_03565 [Okeania sp. SIO2F4]|uniref:hypothetical protein n=1 Tax=Okeania sp. SIO2F4 TaxID=2607790 RepID=UPI0014293E66|nr:hypothetical protein [Okeania sp. SIO2F4]NES01984.1 hypothetical protein [Okeania sp. SIO2F4]